MLPWWAALCRLCSLLLMSQHHRNLDVHLRERPDCCFVGPLLVGWEVSEDHSKIVLYGSMVLVLRGTQRLFEDQFRTHCWDMFCVSGNYRRMGTARTAGICFAYSETSQRSVPHRLLVLCSECLRRFCTLSAPELMTQPLPLCPSKCVRVNEGAHAHARSMCYPFSLSVSHAHTYDVHI